MFWLFQTFRPDSRGTSNRASGTRSGVRRLYSKIFKQLWGNIIEGKKYIQLQLILSPVKTIISLKNICLFTEGLEQAVSLRTLSLLAAISQQSLEEVSKSNIFFVKPQLPGPGGYIFYVSRWHHSGQRHG